MKIYVLKKKEHRKYSSDDLLQKVLFAEGLADFKINRGEKGKPYITSSSSAPPFHISVSHTIKYWVCALSQSSAVGIDIEECARTPGRNISRVLHPLEQHYLSLFSEGSREWFAEFLNVWTRKESYIKFSGNGLSEGLDSFSVINEDDEYADTIKSQKGELLYIRNIFVKSDLIAGICTAENFFDFEVLDFYDEGCPLKPAIEQAADLLAVRDYSSGSLIKKLRERGHSPEDAGKAVKALTERGYIDDVDFAKRFAWLSLQKGKGKRRIEKELAEKGIDHAITQEIISEMMSRDESSETKRALEQASGMLEAFKPEDGQGEKSNLTEKQLGKIARRLSALGYESSTIYEVIGMLRR